MVPINPLAARTMGVLAAERDDRVGGGVLPPGKQATRLTHAIDDELRIHPFGRPAPRKYALLSVRHGPAAAGGALPCHDATCSRVVVAGDGHRGDVIPQP